MDLRTALFARSILAIAVIAASTPAAANAAPAAGIAASTNLVTFDTSAPSDVRVRPLTGLQTATEIAIGLDTRPATGELFVLTVPFGTVAAATIRTYKVDPVSAAATFVGSVPGTLPTAGDRATGMDFNPRVDRIRLVQSNNENGRINPVNGGLAGDDANLTYTGPATGPVAAVAHDRNIAPGPPGTPAPPGSQTTLYGIDTGSDMLVTQGGINGGGPGGPNGGAIAAVGSLGVSVVDTSDPGFDIAANGTAYASLRSVTTSTSALYTVDLTTGAATLVGSLPLDLHALTILAPDNCPLLSGDDQADLDGDGQGDACDDDIDGDGVSNAAEQARGTDPRKVDSDGDGVPDGADACATLAGSGQNGCPDDTAPTITLRRAPSRVTHKRFFAGIASRISVSEASSLDVALLGRARSARPARAGDIVLAERHLGVSARTRSVRLRPKRRLLAGRKRFSVRLRVIATDRAGNRRTKTKTIRVAG